MDALDALERDMPGMEDYQGIRDSIQGWMADEARKRGALYMGDNELANRFADMPFVEIDKSRYFGEGKEIADSGDISGKNLIEWAKKAFSHDKRYSIENLGDDIIISVKSIRHDINHGYNKLKFATVPFIPEIIKNSIFIATTPKSSKLKSHIFANKIKVEGKEYVVGIVIREDVNGKRFYDHELTEIIDPDSLPHVRPSQEGQGIGGLEKNRGTVMNLLRDKLGVKDGTGKVFFQDALHAPVVGAKADLSGPG